MRSLRCPNGECLVAGVGNVIRHGFYQTSTGKRRRYLCRGCRKTTCSNACIRTDGENPDAQFAHNNGVHGKIPLVSR